MWKWVKKVIFCVHPALIDTFSVSRIQAILQLCFQKNTDHCNQTKNQICLLFTHFLDIIQYRQRQKYLLCWLDTSLQRINKNWLIQWEDCTRTVFKSNQFSEGLELHEQYNII